MQSERKIPIKISSLHLSSSFSSVAELVGAATDISSLLSKSFTIESDVKYTEDLK